MINKSVLVLIRHGESIYNKKNLFTGWEDVELTDKGKSEAYVASSLIENIKFTHAFTSKLKRAQHTLNIILDTINQAPPIVSDISLNERDYGSLVGQNKAEASKKYGEKQVQIWRRSYETPPPNGESLEMTANRCIPYFKKNIDPLLKGNNSVIISAHGNSIRSIVMYLHNFNSEQILETEIGWCEPWIYTFESGVQKSFELIARPDDLSKSHLPLETSC